MSKPNNEKGSFNIAPITQALIYCRVSSDRQVVDGHGLNSQELRCINFAKHQGLTVAKVFPDEGISGKLFDRPAMQELIKYVNDHPKERYAIIFDDVSRFARDVKVHLQLRSEFISKGAKLMCPNFNFEDSPDGEFAEIITAASVQYDRQKNRRQVVQKQAARLEAGYWAFGHKKGYKMIKDPVHGKIGVPDHEGAALKEAAEGFASGVFSRKIDAIRFLQDKGVWTKQKAEKYLDKFTQFLRDPYNAGFIEYVHPPIWNITRRPGKHTALISLETFELIQKRLRKTDLNQRVRVDTSPDFPHRGLIICADCKGHLTACKFKGRNKQVSYPRYICHNATCPSYNKTISAKDIETGFKELLIKGRMKMEIDLLLKKMFDRTWKDEVEKIKETESLLEQQKRALENKLVELTNMVINAKSPAVKSVYEKQVENIAKEIEGLGEKSTIGLDMSIPYQTALDKATLVLKKPDIAWEKLAVHEQHGLFFFLFMEKLPYSIKEGYQTAEIPTAAMLFEDFVASTTSLVEMPGVKPGSKTKPFSHCSQD